LLLLSARLTVIELNKLKCEWCETLYKDTDFSVSPMLFCSEKSVNEVLW